MKYNAATFFAAVFPKRRGHPTGVLFVFSRSLSASPKNTISTDNKLHPEDILSHLLLSPSYIILTIINESTTPAPPKSNPTIPGSSGDVFSVALFSKHPLLRRHFFAKLAMMWANRLDEAGSAQPSRHLPRLGCPAAECAPPEFPVVRPEIPPSDRKGSHYPHHH